MTHTTAKVIKNAHAAYVNSNLYCLSDCYTNASYYKQRAFDYCRAMYHKYSGKQGRITGYNSQVFSYAFVGEIDGRPAFFYITRDYDRFIYIDELEG